jgi:hypothetical protein
MWSSLSTSLIQCVAATLSLREERTVLCALDRRTQRDLLVNPQRVSLQLLAKVFLKGLWLKTVPRLQCLTLVLSPDLDIMSLLHSAHWKTLEASLKVLRSFTLTGALEFCPMSKNVWLLFAYLPTSLHHLTIRRLCANTAIELATFDEHLAHLTHLKTLDVSDFFVDRVVFDHILDWNPTRHYVVGKRLLDLPQHYLTLCSRKLRWCEYSVFNVHAHWSMSDLLFRFSVDDDVYDDCGKVVRRNDVRVRSWVEKAKP